jgi:hypothetical protein
MADDRDTSDAEGTDGVTLRLFSAAADSGNQTGPGTVFSFGNGLDSAEASSSAGPPFIDASASAAASAGAAASGAAASGGEAGMAARGNAEGGQDARGEQGAGVDDIANPCLRALINNMWEDGLNPRQLMGPSLSWLVRAVASREECLAGLYARDLANLVVTLPAGASGEGELSLALGPMIPGDPHYVAAHEAYMRQLEGQPGPPASPHLPRFIAQSLKVLVRAAYLAEHGGGSATVRSSVSGPSWVEPLMRQLVMHSRSPSGAADASKAPFTVARMLEALTHFNNLTGLRFGLYDVAGAKAAKLIFDALADPLGPTLATTERAAPWNLQAWADFHGVPKKEKQDAQVISEDGITTVSCLGADFAAGCSSALVCDQYELWFHTVHVLACLTNRAQTFITLGAYPGWLRAMREAARVMPGSMLLSCIRSHFRKAILAVNSSIGLPVPVTFDQAFDPAKVEETLTMSTALVSLVPKGPVTGASVSASGTQDPKGGKKDAEAKLRDTVDNQKRQIANLKGGRASKVPRTDRLRGAPPVGGAPPPAAAELRPDQAGKVRGGVDDSPLGQCKRTMRSGQPCGNTDFCNRCHKHKADWVAQDSR